YPDLRRARCWRQLESLRQSDAEPDQLSAARTAGAARAILRVKKMKVRLAAMCVFAIVAVVSPSLSAQWRLYPTAGAARTPDGKVRLDAPTPRAADGKPDLSGIWETVRSGSGQQVVGPDVPPLSRTSPFWNIGAGLDGDLPLRPWALELRARRVADNSKDNPDAHCLPLGVTQLHNHPQPRKIIQTPS